MAGGGRPFGEYFEFRRPVALDGAGIDQPRFAADGGTRTGLLIDGGARIGLGDRATARPGAWEIDAAGQKGRATVFHAMLDADGRVRRTACYTLTARVTIDALLGTAGVHVSIGAAPGYLRNLGGFVRYRAAEWALPGVLAKGDGRLVIDGGGRPLIEG